jgi:hypothetical protein
VSDEFDLRALVREVCDSHPSPDPTMLAKEVNQRIGEDDRDVALEQALMTVVMHTVSRSRHSASPGGQWAPETQMRFAAGGFPSHKVASIREAWRRVLHDRISVGPEPDAWKFLGDCTVADLSYAAALREEHARRTAARAAQYRRLAALLTEHGVTTVGQLPESVLGEHLTGDDE